MQNSVWPIIGAQVISLMNECREPVGLISKLLGKVIYLGRVLVKVCWGTSNSLGSYFHMEGL